MNIFISVKGKYFRLIDNDTEILCCIALVMMASILKNKLRYCGMVGVWWRPDFSVGRNFVGGGKDVQRLWGAERKVFCSGIVLPAKVFSGSLT